MNPQDTLVRVRERALKMKEQAEVARGMDPIKHGAVAGTLDSEADTLLEILADSTVEGRESEARTYREALDSAAFALQRIEERLNAGKTGDPKRQIGTCHRIAQEELVDIGQALSQSGPTPTQPHPQPEGESVTLWRALGEKGQPITSWSTNKRQHTGYDVEAGLFIRARGQEGGPDV